LNATTSQNLEQLTLEDLALDVKVSLKENQRYTFTSEIGDNPDRFILHFGIVGIDDDITLNNNIQIWSYNKTINILNTNNYIGDIKVVNMYGQTVLSTKLNGDSTQKLIINAPSGYYIINTITQKGVVNKKVYLR
jgi:hypothetical protein